MNKSQIMFKCDKALKWAYAFWTFGSFPAATFAFNMAAGGAMCLGRKDIATAIMEEVWRMYKEQVMIIPLEETIAVVENQRRFFKRLSQVPSLQKEKLIIESVANNLCDNIISDMKDAARRSLLPTVFN